MIENLTSVQFFALLVALVAILSGIYALVQLPGILKQAKRNEAELKSLRAARGETVREEG